MFHGIERGDEGAKELRRLLAWLDRHFRVVPLLELVATSSTEPVPSGSMIAVTFDDGFRSVGRFAYPVLREMSIPATVFACPGLVEDGRWLWNHEVRQRLQRLDSRGFAAVQDRLGRGRDTDREGVVGWMKGLSMTDRRRAEDVVREATPGFSPTQAERDAFDLMTWEELLALDSSIVTIGSHTTDHPILTTLDDDQLAAQLHGSRRLLEQRLGRSVSTFCYPNGAEDQRVRDAVRQVYAAAVTTQWGSVLPGADALSLKRVPASTALPDTAWRMYRLAG